MQRWCPSSSESVVIGVLSRGRRRAAPLATCVLLAAVSCQSTPSVEVREGGDTSAEYSWGKLIKQFDVPLQEAFQATRTTMRELSLRKTSIERDGFTGHFEYMDLEGNTINIRLEKLSRARTEVSIRVGLLGDRRQSTILLDELERRMPVARPTPTAGWEEPVGRSPR